ncbi:putative ribonuclease H-like domain-containing protein [Tanacetum coccineum]
MQLQHILLSAIPDRHLLSFHDAVDARSLWKAIKARFGGNEASKKMQKNLLKQQFETFTIGSREELDSAYERFQHILSMLELHDATVSIEDANLKFLRSLPSVWHVVATMIRGQPGLDELDFDDLYNNLKVYEHELKGVSNSNSQNIAFLSTEVKGSTLKQSTAEPAHIPKGYTQAISSKVPTAPNCVSHSDEIICSFFAQQASMPTTHDDEDLLQIDEDLVILRAPRKNDVYSLDLKNIIPSGGITCLVAKATEDEAVLWHRRLGHVNFKNINKLVKGNLVRGLPSKTFKLDHSCVACRKGKQHRASCKKIEERTVREPLELLHMDLFGPVSVESINKKKYCLVVTDDCSKFSWVFFLAYKDETYDMLHDLIVGLENRLRHKVKTIRCDHGTEFKNQLMNEFCAKKGIKREYSIARTPQQNGVAERKNRTLIEAARTMLADSLLPIQFWAEAVNTACYVLNRVLVTKPQMKTPYEILMGRSPNISFMRPFGCSLTILNTLDHLGKFDGKSEEGYLLGYSTNSKGFRVYNRVTRKVQDCLHVNFLENQENQKGKGPDWMFDLDLLTPSMNYIPVRKENYANSGDKVSTLDDVEDLDDQQFIVHTAQPMHPEERTADKEIPLSSAEQALHDELVSLMHQESLAKAHNDDQRIAFEEEKKRIALDKGKECVDSTFTLSTANTPPQSTGNTPTDSDDDIPKDGIFSTNSFDAEEGGVADYNNMDSTIDVPSTPTLRIHKIHPQSQIIGKSTAGVQTRRKLKESTSDQHQALLSFIYKQNRTNHKDQQTCLFACFLSQEEPKKVSQALADESWVEAMQEELLQFKLQEVWVLCDLPDGKRVIGTKWVFRNKRDERGTIIKNKARLVAQGYRQEEGVDYDEVFAPVARIEAINTFMHLHLSWALQSISMDVKMHFCMATSQE